MSLFKNLFCLTLLSLGTVAFGQSSTNANQPASEVKKEPQHSEAWNKLKESRNTRYYWNKLRGFRADIIVYSNTSNSEATASAELTRVLKGHLDYDFTGGANVQIDGLPDDETWVVEWIQNIFGHRRQGEFQNGDGRFPITFAPLDAHTNLLGRLVLLNDPMKSSYRINNEGIVTQVNRTIGDEEFTIDVLKEKLVDEKRRLPEIFTVIYRNNKTGSIKRTEVFNDEYKQVGDMWVPVSRRAIITKNGGEVSTRRIEFLNHAIYNLKPQQ
jgi:uncharacterized protein DUF3386